MGDDFYVGITDVEKCWYKDVCQDYQAGDCNRPCMRCVQTSYLFQTSGLPESLWIRQNLRTDELSQRTRTLLLLILDNVKFWVKSGFNLYLYGTPGAGKTSWAVKILNNYFSVIADVAAYECHGLYINVPSFLKESKLRLTYKSETYLEYLKTVENCDLVIWDDIGQTNPTDYESQCLYSYINSRVVSKKANIFTSNMSPEELHNMDYRLGSRICSGADCLLVEGTDKRVEKTFSHYMKGVFSNGPTSASE